MDKPQYDIPHVVYRGISPSKSCRKQGPALIYDNGTTYFSDCDSAHGSREKGPAVIYADGVIIYKQNSHLHRVDGPAYIDGNCKEYWVNGIKLTPLEFFAVYGVV